MKSESMKQDSRVSRRYVMRLLVAVPAAALLLGCSQKDHTEAQGPAQVKADVQVLLDDLGKKGVTAAKASGRVFLPSRWRSQIKQDQDLQALADRLKTSPKIEIGPIKMASRWALVEYIKIDGKKFQPDKPWFFVFYARHWAWVSPGSFKDSAVSGMMDLRFDRLYRQWEIEHGIKPQA